MPSCPQGFRRTVSTWGPARVMSLALSLLEKLGNLPLCDLPQLHHQEQVGMGQGHPEVDGRIGFVDRLPSVGDDPGQRAQEIAPDHALVTAKFDL